jgi:DNA/RNA-binding domain of Phe-tRNA-synthetase-like protein
MDEFNIETKTPEITRGTGLSLAILENVLVTKSVPENTAIFEEIGSTLRDTHTIEDVKNHPIVRAYRDFYWRVLKIDPTKTRPSSEALARRILVGNPMPQISNIVDAYNAASLVTYVSLGAYNSDKAPFPLKLRVAGEGEQFEAIGAKQPVVFEGNELVLCNADGAILNQYPHRDANFSRVTDQATANVLIACGVPGVSMTDLNAAIEKSVEYINRVQPEPCEVTFRREFSF